MEKAENDDEKEDLEEGDENEGLGRREKDKGQESGEAAVPHCWPGFPGKVKIGLMLLLNGIYFL